MSQRHIDNLQEHDEKVQSFNGTLAEAIATQMRKKDDDIAQVRRERRERRRDIHTVWCVLCDVCCMRYAVWCVMYAVCCMLYVVYYCLHKHRCVSSPFSLLAHIVQMSKKLQMQEEELDKRQKRMEEKEMVVQKQEVELYRLDQQMKMTDMRYVTRVGFIGDTLLGCFRGDTLGLVV